MNGQLVALDELFKIGSSKRVLKSEWKTEGVPFYRGREITKLAVDGFVENELFISEQHFAELAQQSGVPTAGDIVITAIGTIGNSYIVREADRFYFKDASVLWMKRRADVSSEYINFWLKSPLFFDQLDRGNGATVDTLTIQKLQGVRLSVPPLPDQHRIVGILDEAFDGIATAKANSEKNLLNARGVFESHLQSVFAKQEDEWKEALLEFAVDAKCTLSYGIVQPGDEHQSGLPIVRPTDLTKKVITLQGLKRIDPKLAEGYKRTTLRGNELLLCVRGSTGSIAVSDPELVGANVTRGIVPIVFDPALVQQEFGYFLMISGLVQKQVRQKTYGTALMQINIGDLRKIKVRFPPLESQAEITAKLTELSDQVDRLEWVYQQKLNAFDDLKKSLLHQAFTGQL